MSKEYTSNVLELLERTAARFPDKPAFGDPSKEMTFGELVRKAQAAGTLLADRIGIGSPVAFYMEKSVDAVTAMFGAVYAGGFYSFVDVRQPAARAAKVLGVLAPAVVITDDASAEKAEQLKKYLKEGKKESNQDSNGTTSKNDAGSAAEYDGQEVFEEETSDRNRTMWIRIEDLLSDADRMTDDGREPEGERESSEERGRVQRVDGDLSAAGRRGSGDQSAAGRGGSGDQSVIGKEINRDLTGKLAAIREQVTDNDILYVNFTSGSTGTPKGVAVCHRSVIEFISYFAPLFGINEDDIIANQAPFDFDVSVKDIYSGLYTGAKIQLVPREYFSNPTKLMDYLCDHEVTVLIWAVSAMCFVSIMNGLEYKTPERVRLVMFSGEVMPVKQLNVWRRYLPSAVYVNLYGPTEITCNCTYYVLPKEKEWGLSDVIPAGKAFPNEKVFLLDEQDRLIEPIPGPQRKLEEYYGRKISEGENGGVKTGSAAGEGMAVPAAVDKEGEICVGGTCVALGYYRDPSRTAAAFVQNPLNDGYPERIYRTGDIGRYDADGNLIYVSRKDFQIKHMGHRIELGEIEADAMARDGVSRAACLYDAEKKRLILFYTGERDRKDLEKELKEVLPPFMLPNRTIQLEEMPLNKNGKIDRNALKLLLSKGNRNTI